MLERTAFDPPARFPPPPLFPRRLSPFGRGGRGDREREDEDEHDGDDDEEDDLAKEERDESLILGSPRLAESSSDAAAML